ncbi:hypothetical protein F2P81_007396 [Scophthalmus maximus]|uniref:CMP-N-acetylneuraminate-beta-galactosamide-alpha-2,3-sialyltransferase 2 n=1 Tax=Scophthalmus maximus TaxID=52904 RepID=A0A6A4TAR0_SCOMX|nr:hypothetical protein F2P81_007396 [Scophthalmus maximus]
MIVKSLVCNCGRFNAMAYLPRLNTGKVGSLWLQSYQDAVPHVAVQASWVYAHCDGCDTADVLRTRVYPFRGNRVNFGGHLIGYCIGASGQLPPPFPFTVRSERCFKASVRQLPDYCRLIKQSPVSRCDTNTVSGRTSGLFKPRFSKGPDQQRKKKDMILTNKEQNQTDTGSDLCSTEQETRRGGQTFDDDIIHLHNFAGRQTQQCNLLYISVRVRRIWVLLGSLVLVFLTSLFFSVSLRGGVGFNYLEPPGWEESRRVKLVPSYAGAHSLSAPDAPQQKTCACTRCVGDPGVSDWFDENYDPDISPVWTRDNIQLPSDVYYWWVMLQPQFKPHSIQQVLLRLFQVIPGRSPYGSWDPGRCLRCAVVGNSGNLRGAGYGPTIDGHNYVMRINLAPTVGYEEDAGSHTTHHFMYPESAKNLAANVSFVLVPFKTLDLVWITSALSTGQIRFTYAPVKQFLRVDKDKVQIFNPAFFKYIHDHWTRHHGRYPSTGMLVLFFALHVCDEVNVFGFGADSRGNWHHYWEQNRYSGEFRKTGVHDADYEAQIIQQLAKAGKITVFPGK